MSRSVNPGDTLTLGGGVATSNGNGTIQYIGAGNLMIAGGLWPIGTLQDTAAGNLSISGSLGAAAQSRIPVRVICRSAAEPSIGTNLTNSSPGSIYDQRRGQGRRHGHEFGLSRQSDHQWRSHGHHADEQQHLGDGDRLSDGRLLGNHRDHQWRLWKHRLRWVEIQHPLQQSRGPSIRPVQTVTFNGGTWILNTGGQYQSSLVVQSGLVTLPAAAGDFLGLESLTVHGGTLNSANTYGMRMGNQFGANNNTGVNFAGIQTGGLVSVTNTNSSAMLQLDPPPTASPPATR